MDTCYTENIHYVIHILYFEILKIRKRSKYVEVKKLPYFLDFKSTNYSHEHI